MSKANDAILKMIGDKNLEMIRYMNKHKDVFQPYLNMLQELNELRDQKHRILMNRASDLYKKPK